MTIGSLLDAIIQELDHARGLDFCNYCRAPLLERLALQLEKRAIAEPADYLQMIKSEPAEVTALVSSLVVTVSSFFRDPLVFEQIAERVLPKIIQSNRRSRGGELRLWSAGCATGEEPYALAILAAEALEGERGTWQNLVFATDIDSQALAEAEGGRYPREQLATTKLDFVDRYFVEQDGWFQVRDGIRKGVKFSVDDVTSKRTFAPAESVFGSFDLVLCRNVLIYLRPETQKMVLQRLARSLVRGGYLILGAAETLSWGGGTVFRAVDESSRIFLRA